MIISHLKTFFRINKEEVVIYSNGEQYGKTFHFRTIQKTFNISSYELELLIGYEINPDNLKENNFNLEEARKVNKDKLLEFKKIIDIKEGMIKHDYIENYYISNDVYTVYFDDGTNYIFNNYNAIKNASKILIYELIELAIGLNCYPEFYKLGEQFENGGFLEKKICQLENTDIKLLNIRYDYNELNKEKLKEVEALDAKREKEYLSYCSKNRDCDDYDRDYFDTMTDGQLGDYGDFIERGGNIDDINTWARG